ncbi:MAG TPA: SAM-dependent methyltransferase [Nannocystis sp.]
MHDIVAAACFRLIQVLLSPLGAVGYVIFVARLIAYSRESGASATVLASLYTRYMQHVLGSRRDEPAARLMAVMPNVPALGLLLSTAPTRVAHAVTGHVPRIYRYPYPGEPPIVHQSAARTTFSDDVVARHLVHADQLVILGAGFDTRAYRLPAGASVRCFEVDAPPTQAYKREMLAKAGVDPGPVRFVAADFATEDWFAKLVAAGFDPDRPGVFIWESVTMYLPREAVVDALRKISRTAPGTVVAFDYMSAELLASRSLFLRYARAVMAASGEAWRFGIDNTPPARARVAELLTACGLVLAEQRNFGPETARTRAPAGFAVAVVPPAGYR